MSNCSNCGHMPHCGEKCMQTYKDGDGKDVTIECCKECRCEKLRDKQLYILEDSLPVLDSNQVYYFELEGLKVMNLDNFELGKIKGILETNANDVLVIEPTDSSIDERERWKKIWKNDSVDS